MDQIRIDRLKLQEELVKLFEMLQKQIDQFRVTALDIGCQVYELKFPDGTFAISPLLIAQVNALAALARLQEVGGVN